MEYRILGKTGIRVSRLCFGSLTIGPLQANLSADEGARLIELALDLGVNFIDTAQLYGTYKHIKRAISGRNDKPVIASKSYAYTKAGMYESLQMALDELDLPCIDIFLLHEQESALTLKGHREALEYLLEAKDEGLVKAVGISTHTIAALKAVQTMPEIDVVHPLINKMGVGIVDGSATEMLRAIAALKQNNVGIFGMKPLGGGHLIGQNKEALRFVLSQPSLDAIAVGMVSAAEIRYNCALFSGEIPPIEDEVLLRQKKRALHIHDWCTGCGKCVEHCPQRALQVLDGTVKVQQNSCVLCGYCGAYCPDFCLKIF